MMEFVDNFSNSSSHLDYSPKKKKNMKAWYAEWEDNYMGDFINNPVTRTCLRKVADRYYAKQLDEIIETATELSTNSYPSLFEVYENCCNKLGMPQMPKAFITGRLQGINALSVEVKKKQLILISRSVVMRLSPLEQAFILGHELGHHQQGNLVCHTVNGLMDSINNSSEIFGPMIADTIEVPLKRWCRSSEYNADRAGYICCENKEVIKELFRKLGMRPTLSAYNEYNELESSHPHFHTRLAVLSEYNIVEMPLES